MKRRENIIRITIFLAALQLARAAIVLMLTLAFGITAPVQAILSIGTILLLMGFLWMVMLSQGVRLPVWPSKIPGKTMVIYVGGASVVLVLIILRTFVPNGFSVGNLMTALYFGIVIPLYEELLFRGYIWASLETVKMSPRNIAVFTAVAFSLWQLGYWDVALFRLGDSQNLGVYLLVQVGVSLVQGLLLAYVRYKSKNCYAGMLVHGVLNVLGI